MPRPLNRSAALSNSDSKDDFDDSAEFSDARPRNISSRSTASRNSSSQGQRTRDNENSAPDVDFEADEFGNGNQRRRSALSRSKISESRDAARAEFHPQTREDSRRTRALDEADDTLADDTFYDDFDDELEGDFAPRNAPARRPSMLRQNVSRQGISRQTEARDGDLRERSFRNDDFRAGDLRPSSLRDAARRASISPDERRNDERIMNSRNPKSSTRSSPQNEYADFDEREDASYGRADNGRTNTRDSTARNNAARGEMRSAAKRGEVNGTGKSGAGAKRSAATRKVSSRDFLAREAKTPPRALWYEIGGVLSLATGVLLLWNTRLATSEIGGALPRLAIGALRALFGIGAVVAPLILCSLGVLLIARHHRANLRAFRRGALAAFLVLLTATHLAVPRGREFADATTISSHGGYLGATLAWLLRKAVGDMGAIIALIALSVVAILLWSELSLAQTLARGRSSFRRAARALRERVTHRASYEDDFDDEYNRRIGRDGIGRDGVEKMDGDWRDPREARASEVRANSRRQTRALLEAETNEKSQIEYSNSANAATNSDKNARRPLFLSVDELLQEGAPKVSNETSPAENVAAAAPDLSPKIEFTDAPPPTSVLDSAPEVSASGENAISSPESANRVLETPTSVAGVQSGNAVSENAKSEDEMTPTEKLEAQALASATAGESAPRAPRIEKPRRRFGDGPLMPEYFDDAVRALDPPIVPDLEGAEDDIHAGVKAVTETLASFKIDARVTDVKRGPVITRYEVQPAPGVRVATIAALDRDMSRALSAIAVRIEAPVPGKDIIGIEVPNKKVNLVRLRDVLERHDFLSTQSKLAFVLGKDIAGQPKWADLTKMPHMLVAGATNSGKSVCLNSIIASILVRATPEEVKFSLIDPKRVELTLFNGIKHLYHPVVVEPKGAVKVLRGMIAEMDRRYKLFAERGVRNIVSHNSKLEEDEAPLPYIVIVIDELADLMMTAAAEFEKLICRLAQLARATGIHLIVATQRPSVNVITGVIKANIPSRIAFAVASQVDSRTILDSMGAERLIGSGDMLFDANNGGKAIRIQGAFLSEDEVNRVVDVVKAAYADDETPMEYGMDISAVDEEDVNEANEKTVARSEKKDELYEEILEYVVRSTEMSASMIQRKFEIGYPRAARIVDQFERDGVLSPANGSKPRKVIGNGRGISIN